MHSDRPHDGDRAGTWPYSSILIFGYFGKGSPGGRRLYWRTMAALAVAVFSVIALQSGFVPGVPAAVWALLFPAAVAAMVVAHLFYLRGLDELTRLLQLKAYAFAYGCAMVLAAVLVAVSLLARTALHPSIWLAVLVVAEPARAAALGWLARHYE